jgi:hypothetical protein
MNKWRALINSNSKLPELVRAGIEVYFSSSFVQMGQMSILFMGKIHNGTELIKKISKNMEISQGGDAELILYLYSLYGIEHTLQLVDGVFSFILLDNSVCFSEKLFVARDPIGICPLFEFEHNGGIVYSTDNNNLYEDAISFPSGTYSSYFLKPVFTNSIWQTIEKNKQYFSLSIFSMFNKSDELFYKYLERAVEKRLPHFQEPVGLYCSSVNDDGCRLLHSILYKLCKKTIIYSENKISTDTIVIHSLDEIKEVRIVFFSLGYLPEQKNGLDFTLKDRDTISNIHKEIPKILGGNHYLEPQYPFLDKDYLTYYFSQSI